MNNYKTKWFRKWAQKVELTDAQLRDALIRIGAGLGVVSLGGHLYKVRIGRDGHGRSGGYRTIVVFKEAARSLFIFGFEKNDMDNIDKATLADYKKYAKAFLDYSNDEVMALLKTEAIFPVEEE